MLGVVPWTKPVIGSRELFPSYPMNRLASEFAPIFNRLFAGWPVPYEGWTYPEVYRGISFEETEKEYMFFVEAPGFDVKDFEISLIGNMLTVKAEHKEANGEKKEVGFYFGERCLERSVSLPVGAEPEKIYAAYKNGILEVHVPKCAEVKPRRIVVKS